ncbi:MAG: NAD(P)H-dependent oxidoreductase [Planctomycetaceae bacterium]|nr:NAD(P)H-dependent oxidoreductase [Planctomycetaceae bacterium]
MKRLLHIIASPRGDDSRTLQASGAFLDEFKATHRDWAIDALDVTKEDLPSLTSKRVDGKYVLLGGGELYGDLKEAWEEIIEHINRFLAADGYLVSTPMWNFGIPYPLKQYIDVIVQPKYLFRYTDHGVEGFAKGKKMVVISSRGGEYVTPEGQRFDHVDPYLRDIFGFVGITDITFIHAEPMDAMGIAVQRQKLEEACGRAKQAAQTF